MCSVCLRRRPVFDGLAAAFDYAGPAASLIRKLKYSDQPYLAKGCGAYLAAQVLRLEWPIPDAIVPVPLSLSHWFERGYNQSALMAETLSEILKSSVCHALKRKSGDYSQAGLSRQQRVQLDGSTIQLKQGLSLQDKHILLVDDVTTTGSTLRKCAEALLEASPSSIYGITVCRAVK